MRLLLENQASYLLPTSTSSAISANTPAIWGEGISGTARQIQREVDHVQHEVDRKFTQLGVVEVERLTIGRR